MLLLLTSLAVGVAGIVISNKTCSYDLKFITAIISIISFNLLILCLGIFCIQAITESSEKAKMQAKHDTIMQMMEDKSNVETLTRYISEYNGEILSGRERRKSPWIGIFVYDFYDDLMTIEVGHLEHGR
jgi:hypothetical protein